MVSQAKKNHDKSYSLKELNQPVASQTQFVV